MNILAAGDALGRLPGVTLSPSYGLVQNCNDDFELNEVKE